MVLIFHGNYETISEWIAALDILSRSGISSCVFDYSGFGNSGGKATFRTFRRDCLAAWENFRDKASKDMDKYLLALSLGTGILLDVYPRLEPQINGVVLIGTFSSFRGMALEKKMLPSFFVNLLPDL